MTQGVAGYDPEDLTSSHTPPGLVANSSSEIGSTSNDPTQERNLQNGGWGGYNSSDGLFATGMGTGSGFSANPQNYADNLNQANGLAQSYYNAGAGWDQQAAQANNARQGLSQNQLAQTYGQQNQLAQQFQGTINNPSSSLASQQYMQGAQQAQAATTALGNSAGAGPMAAGARREAQQTNAVAGAQDVSGLQQVNATAQAQAQSNLAGLYAQQGQLVNGQYALENQNAQNNASLQASQNQLNDSMQAGLYGLSANEQGYGTQALNSYSNDLLGQAGASNEEQVVNNAFGNAMTGAGLSGAGSLTSGLSSLYNQNNNQGSGSGT